MIAPFSSATILLISDQEQERQKVDTILRDLTGSPALCVQNAEEARRILMDTDADLVIIDVPARANNALIFANELARSRSMSFGVIIVTEAEGQDLYQAERMGIVTLYKPLDIRLLAQTMHLLLTFQAKIKRLETQADKLQKKLADDRLIARAKLLLIENLKMSEQEAHHYIEHRAMDACVRKTKIAKEIIRRYGSE